jgi:hypothetical protein
MLKISELIAKLSEIITEYGDIEVETWSSNEFSFKSHLNVNIDKDKVVLEIG